MFSKVLLVLVAVFSVVVASEMVEVQVCENGPKMEVPTKNCTAFSLSNNMTTHIILDVTGGDASNGTLTGLYDTFSDDKCTDVQNSSVTITCSCDDNEELKFVCEASALVYPMVTVMVAAVMAVML